MNRGAPARPLGRAHRLAGEQPEPSLTVGLVHHSLMIVKSRKADRRTQRTRRRLSGALIALVEDKRFDDITVQNVIERADVGRATSYTHFREIGRAHV